MERRAQILFILIAAVGVAACASNNAEVASQITLTSTFSLPSILWCWTLHRPLWTFQLLSAVGFIAWTWPYSVRPGAKRTAILAVVLGLLSLAWFVLGYKYALQYQGAEYYQDVAEAGAGLWAAAAACWYGGIKKKLPILIILANALLFGWAVWLAFPYMGEVP